MCPTLMLLWSNQFVSDLYSFIFWNIFNRSEIRLDSPEIKMAPKFVSNMYIKLYVTPFTRWCPPSVNHSMGNSPKKEVKKNLV